MILTLATTNAGKIREIKEVLKNQALTIKNLSDYPKIGNMPEETGATFTENALIKARYVWGKVGGYVLADDSGLECEDLKGAPGVYSARFAGVGASDEENNQKLIKSIQAKHDACRLARYVCVLALIDPQGLETIIEEVCDGMITFVPTGTGGFGYDPYFYLPEKKCTMAEMPLAEKNKISHRGKALKKLLESFTRHS